MPSKDCTAPRKCQQGITFGSTIVYCLSLFHYFSDMTLFIHSKVGHFYCFFAVKFFCHSTGQKWTIHAIQTATVPIASSHFLSMVTAPNINSPWCSAAAVCLVGEPHLHWSRWQPVCGAELRAGYQDIGPLPSAFYPHTQAGSGKGSNQWCRWEYYARFSEHIRK